MTAVLRPGSGALGHYPSLAAKGLIRLKSTTTADLDQLRRYDIPEDASPLDLLLAEREADTR